MLLDRAAEAGPAYLPGYTHMQRAQPVLLSHHLLAHGWALARDVDRLLATRTRLDVSPLGAGALAGSSLPLDPDGVADDLGFARRFENSLDAVSDRDFVAEALFDLALLGVHLSRMGEEIALWSSEEFGFLVLADAYATGSSMLPQKKNPDIAELVRGKAGRLIGHLTGVLAMLKGLPLAYNRDLQEDKEPLFDAVDTVQLALPALTGLLRTATFVAERMQASADVPTSAATDLAELLVERGMPFREAHALVGALVRDSIERRVPLAELVAVASRSRRRRARAARARRRGHPADDAGRRRSRVGRDPDRPLPQPAREARVAADATVEHELPPRHPDPVRRGRHAGRRVQRALPRLRATTASTRGCARSTSTSSDSAGTSWSRRRPSSGWGRPASATCSRSCRESRGGDARRST